MLGRLTSFAMSGITAKSLSAIWVRQPRSPFHGGSINFGAPAAFNMPRPFDDAADAVGLRPSARERGFWGLKMRAGPSDQRDLLAACRQVAKSRAAWTQTAKAGRGKPH